MVFSSRDHKEEGWKSTFLRRLPTAKSGHRARCLSFAKDRRHHRPLVGMPIRHNIRPQGGYWQIPIDEQDRKKTAFVTTDGLYQLNVLPFGLSNAPASFQRTINSILGALRWDITLVYLDDIIIYSKSFDAHVRHIDQVLTALEKANVKLNPAKCSLVRKQLD